MMVNAEVKRDVIGPWAMASKREGPHVVDDKAWSVKELDTK